MSGWWRRIRAAVAMGVTWATGWGVAGTLYGLWLVSRFPGVGSAFGEALAIGIEFAAVGLVGGAGFAAILGLAERRRRFDQLTLPRFSLWGALGGTLLGLGVVIATGGWGAFAFSRVAFVGVAALLGASSAGGTLVLARAAETRELIDQGAAAAAVGLETEERERLLGPDR